MKTAAREYGKLPGSASWEHILGAHPGSAGILACWVLGNDLLTEASRQGCLRSQDALPGCAPRKFAMPFSEERTCLIRRWERLSNRWEDSAGATSSRVEACWDLWCYFPRRRRRLRGRPQGNCE